MLQEENKYAMAKIQLKGLWSKKSLLIFKSLKEKKNKHGMVDSLRVSDIKLWEWERVGSCSYSLPVSVNLRSKSPLH